MEISCILATVGFWGILLIAVIALSLAAIYRREDDHQRFPTAKINSQARNFMREETKATPIKGEVITSGSTWHITGWSREEKDEYFRQLQRRTKHARDE